MPDSTPLSPAVQAIRAAVDAVFARSPAPPTTDDIAAAVLQAAVDQVVPERDCPDTEEWPGQSAWVQAELGARFRLLAIAAELEGGTSTSSTH